MAPFIQPQALPADTGLHRTKETSRGVLFCGVGVVLQTPFFFAVSKYPVLDVPSGWSSMVPRERSGRCGIQFVMHLWVLKRSLLPTGGSYYEMPFGCPERSYIFDVDVALGSRTGSALAC